MTEKKKKTAAPSRSKATQTTGSKATQKPGTKSSKPPKEAATGGTGKTPEQPPPVLDMPEFITEYDIYLFREGKHYSLFEKLGAHPIKKGRTSGTFFAVWAPNARSVHVIGNFNGWNNSSHPLVERDDQSGIWQGFIAGIGKGEHYKYFIRSQVDRKSTRLNSSHYS